MDYNIRIGVIRLQISSSRSVVSRMIALALTVSEKLTLKNCDNENVGQGHGV